MTIAGCWTTLGPASRLASKAAPRGGGAKPHCPAAAADAGQPAKRAQPGALRSKWADGALVLGRSQDLRSFSQLSQRATCAQILFDPLEGHSLSFRNEAKAEPEAGQRKDSVQQKGRNTSESIQ
jgi:hypothetical protein